MKNACIFYYNLNPDKIQKKDNIYYFKIDNVHYYLYPYYGDINTLNSIYEITQELNYKNIYVHQILLNKDNKIITVINDTMYVMLKVYIKENNLININDILYLTNNTLVKKEKNILIKKDWPTMWERKNDYLEYQVFEYRTKYKNIARSFDYYLGLAENAISYAREALKNNNMEILCLSHKRIDVSYKTFDIFNPVELIIDYRVRDIAEYTKSYFFKKGISPLNEIEEYFKLSNLNKFDACMFFARILYPTYYFDIVEKIIDKIEDENEIEKVEVKSSEYEQFLKEVFLFLSKKYDIPEIAWITNS